MPRISLKAVAGGLAVYLGAAGTAYLWMNDPQRAPPCCPTPAHHDHASPALSPAAPPPAAGAAASPWTRLSRTYDAKIASDELVIGVSLMRRLLCRHARGCVLEVSAGTGRNLAHLPGRAAELVLTDKSESMLAVAQEKVAALPADVRARVRAEVAAVERLPYADHTFDTVVDTFGLCSCEDPEQALREMQRVCKPDGMVLLLEHGRSTWPRLAGYQDRVAAQREELWGCWWNRDLDGALARAGFRELACYHWHFGTTLYVVARPGLAASASTAAV